MKQPSRFLKSTAGVFSGIFFLQGVVFASTPESNIWTERRKAAASAESPSSEALQLAGLPSLSEPGGIFKSLPLVQGLESSGASKILQGLPAGTAAEFSPLINALPYEFGTLRQIALPPAVDIQNKTPPVVVLIQDVHCNAEAQKNIGAALQSLIDEKKIDVLGLEGAFGPVSMDRFRAYPRKEVTKSVADYFLKKTRISGAIHTALTSRGDIPPIVGVDDFDHYHKNVEAYRISAPKLKELREKLSQALDAQRNKRGLVLNLFRVVFPAACGVELGCEPIHP